MACLLEARADPNDLGMSYDLMEDPITMKRHPYDMQQLPHPHARMHTQPQTQTRSITGAAAFLKRMQRWKKLVHVGNIQAAMCRLHLGPKTDTVYCLYTCPEQSIKAKETEELMELV